VVASLIMCNVLDLDSNYRIVQIYTSEALLYDCYFVSGRRGHNPSSLPRCTIYTRGYTSAIKETRERWNAKMQYQAHTKLKQNATRANHYTTQMTPFKFPIQNASVYYTPFENLVLFSHDLEIVIPEVTTIFPE